MGQGWAAGSIWFWEQWEATRCSEIQERPQIRQELGWESLGEGGLLLGASQESFSHSLSWQQMLRGWFVLPPTPAGVVGCWGGLSLRQGTEAAVGLGCAGLTSRSLRASRCDCRARPQKGGTIEGLDSILPTKVPLLLCFFSTQPRGWHKGHHRLTPCTASPGPHFYPPLTLSSSTPVHHCPWFQGDITSHCPSVKPAFSICLLCILFWAHHTSLCSLKQQHEAAFPVSSPTLQMRPVSCEGIICPQPHTAAGIT